MFEASELIQFIEKMLKSHDENERTPVNERTVRLLRNLLDDLRLAAK